ncbi:DUF2306 domain-containing protein [Streptosporangium sp. CA-135522]|uniref:DUF2306 domain-containing protein n=1 Tax=Streptosporangium sp. CA-135522 TaxID=3240072 RepID=UPI003D946F3B
MVSALKQDIKKSDAPAPHTEGSGERARSSASAARTAPRWWRRPWIIPLALLVTAFLAFQATRFAGLNESEAPIPRHDGFPLYYPLLIGHMAFGAVAMVTVCFQAWPWLRRNHPAVHRVSGRVYVLSTLPCGVIGLVIVGFAPPTGRVGVAVGTVLWLATTVMGFWMARGRRYDLHRRFMLYSFAILMNIIAALLVVIVGLSLPFGIGVDVLVEVARWSWVAGIVLVDWHLYRHSRRLLRRRPLNVTYKSPA